MRRFSASFLLKNWEIGIPGGGKNTPRQFLSRLSRTVQHLKIVGLLSLGSVVKDPIIGSG